MIKLFFQSLIVIYSFHWTVQQTQDQVVHYSINVEGNQDIDESPSPQSKSLHRQLNSLSIDIDSNFRRFEGFGLLGFYEGGIYLNSSELSCALLCVQDYKCLSFQLDETKCYISHTTQYHHPDYFKEYSTSTYFEWKGKLQIPTFQPNGGVSTTYMTTSIISSVYGSIIKYKIVFDLSTHFVDLNEMKEIKSGDLLYLPDKPCKIFAYLSRPGMNESDLVESIPFIIQASKYGYLIPFFNGNYHGNLIRLKLDVDGIKRPRPAQYLEFSNFNSPLGIGPYLEQVVSLNLTQFQSSFKGFKKGILAMVSVSYISIDKIIWIREKDFKGTSEQFAKASRKIEKEEYLFLISYHTGESFSGTIVKLKTSTIGTEVVDITWIDLLSIDPQLCGFSGGVADNTYLYLSPFKNKDGFSGKVPRIHMDDFSLSSVDVIDLTLIRKELKGFNSVIKYDDYIYFIPFQNQHDQWGDIKSHFPKQRFSGLLARLNLNDFSTVNVLDLSQIESHLVGFSNAFTVGYHLYLVPYMYRTHQTSSSYSMNTNPYSGFIARVNLLDFKTIEYFNMAEKDNELRGFLYGFSSGYYGYLVPHRNGMVDKFGRSHAGKFVRFDTRFFNLNNVSWLDLPHLERSQIPNNPDNDLRGFTSGFTSGKYAYLIPYFDGARFSGKICRINLNDFIEFQLLDLTQMNINYRGFSDGVSSLQQDEMDVSLFGEFKATAGTKKQYEFTY